MRGLLLGTLAALSIPYTSAHPSARKQWSVGKRTIDLDAFRLKVTSNYVNATAVVEDPPVVLNKRASAQDIATELVKETVPGAKFRLVESYTGGNGITHVYFRQTANDLDIDNADFNVNIGPDGKIFSFGNSFYEGEIPVSSDIQKRDRVDPARALKGAVNVLQLPIGSDQATSEPKSGKETFAIKNTSGAAKEPEARLVYLQKADGSLVLTWRVETDILSNWLLSYVDAKSAEQVHGVVDYSADADTKHATYEVYPWGVNDPTDGNRKQLKNPWIDSASEFGWHSTGSENFLTTRGNNGIAQSNHANTPNYLNNPRPYPGSLSFKFDYSPEDADWKGYANASIAQLFYTANTYHDLLHVLGFNEAAGNFEFNNNGAGGVGNDFVILNAQDGSGMNNANFATPPDGQSGRMRMYMWDTATPWRDCSFDAGVVIHEYTHGVSNRLTGGPANSGCLSLLEAGGMGEGWGDFMATAIRLKPQDKRTTDYAMGDWVFNDPKGIRTYVYSTNMKTNPHVYSDVDTITRVHGIGTVWATMLYEVMWNLIDKHGKRGTEFPKFDKNGVPTDGKHLVMKLVLDGMALQPCNPNFVSARDAILDADKALTGGQNQCEIWKGFAKRGLGKGAKYNAAKRTASFDVPEGC